MADKNVTKNRIAERRRRRIRGKVFGSAERPRMTVRKSLKNVFVQIIDDTSRMTLVGLASNSKAMLAPRCSPSPAARQNRTSSRQWTD